MEERAFRNATSSHNANPVMFNVTAVMSIYFLIFLSSTVGNSLVCWIVKKNSSMHSSMNYLLVNLAVADLLVTFSSIYLILTDAAMDVRKGNINCKIQGGTFQVFHRVSIFTLIAIAHNRYRAICKPLENIGRKGCISWVISSIWFLSTVSHTPSFLYCGLLVDKNNQLTCACLDKFPSRRARSIYTVFLFLANYAVPVSLMAYLYAAIVFKLRHRPPGQSGRRYSTYQARRGAIKMLLISLVAFFVSWTPVYLMYLLDSIQVNMKNIYRYVWYPSLLLGFCNSAYNPIIYCLLSKNFREGFKSALCYCCHRRFFSTAKLVNWRRNLMRKPRSGTVCSFSV